MPHVATHRLHAPAADRVWATATLVLAGLALVLALAEQYDAGALVAAVCVLTGGWSMLISRTITERFETVSGTVLGGVLLAVCLAYGSGL
ncbi:MAG: hypothetical protein JWM62_1537 [Frankiales bacterium]|nr:hypothetical protein [Frankiales bacterium]